MQTELLLPAGNIEAFHAAVRGGANAVYLGLKQFNARGRAANFSHYQFLQLLDEARQKGVKVYVTLNTVIKNKELPELIETLNFLSKARPDAVIIQDWGTLKLIKDNFPSLVVHASTQMANHNSAGTAFSKKVGLSRVILARELTLNELRLIQKRSTIETEIFVHGALCYSFSGMCLFSSYLSGLGANRGLCAQPCRRFYQTGKTRNLIFSLKDNQLIELVPEISRLKVASLKIEGRLKSAEYVYNAARAYRLALDKTQALAEARQILEGDFGRDKTSWFYGETLRLAITDNPNTGIALGKVLQKSDTSIMLQTTVELKEGYRLRIRGKKDSEQQSVRIEALNYLGEDRVEVYIPVQDISMGDQVFLTGTHEEKFSSKFRNNPQNIRAEMAMPKKLAMLKPLRSGKSSSNRMLVVRVDNPDWFSQLKMEQIDHLIIQRSLHQWKKQNMNTPFFQRNRNKVWIELPGFISEKSLDAYRRFATEMAGLGFNRFVLSHLSQKELLPKGAVIACNESVYVFNDASAAFLKSQGVKWYTSPVENEYENLLTGSDREQVIPVYGYPRLFYSRQPVMQGVNSFTDENKKEYRKEIRNGITIIRPVQAVSVLQYVQKLANKGFNRLMVDLSFEKPDAKLFQTIVSSIKSSKSMENTTAFNFKKGMK